MKYVPYHRVSTEDQNLDRGIIAIKEFAERRGIKLYKDKVYCDKQTGKNFDRPQYTIVKYELLEPGDVLIITEIDRLGRDKYATLAELQYFKENNIRVMVLELETTLIDLPQDDVLARMMLETINNMMIEMYASFAHAEMLKREKRQREGIKAAKAKGVKFGRSEIMTPAQFKKQYDEYADAIANGEITKADVWRKMGIGKSTFYKYEKKLQEATINAK